MISGGFAGGRESNSARKAHLRRIISGEALEIQVVSKLPRLDTTLTFSDSDMEGCQHPHDDPLVIKAVVANKTIHRVLVDNGSSTDIIFASAFEKNGYWKGEARASQRLPMWILWRKSATSGVDTTSAHFGRPPMPSYNSKISHSRCPISLQHVIGQSLSQYHKGHPLRLPHGYQIPNRKWSRNGSRKPTHSQGVLLNINETKNG